MRLRLSMRQPLWLILHRSGIRSDCAELLLVIWTVQLMHSTGPIKRNDKFTEAFLNLGQAGKEKADPTTAKEALEKAMKLDPDIKTQFPALRMLGLMIHGCGNHMEAVEKWTAALNLKISVFQRVEALFHRGVCYHGLGYHKEAADDYKNAFSNCTWVCEGR
eukprot:jgi/Botrbrau1/6691/Bobra.0202s0029.1